MAKTEQQSHDPVTDYAIQVIAGKIVAGELVILACERHMKDLKTAKNRGLFFDVDAAQYAIDFFKYLRLWEGEWAGCVFELQSWQQFIVGSLFGWKNDDGLRRFRVAYNEVSRKNGKSPLLAGIGLYMLIADEEPGAQVFSAATKRDQAKIIWNHAAQMIKRSPALSKRVKVFLGRGNMHVPATDSKFEPLGADADTTDGLNISCALVDELHAHKTRAMWDVLETATGSRRQPLQATITTAGTDRLSVCYELHEYSIQILKGLINDDTFFAYIATMDEKDDWKNEKVWPKANPNLNVSVKIDDLRRKAEKAKQIPAAQNAFQRLHLNVWTQQINRWLNLDVWDEQAGIVDEEALAGRKCYGGLDLSSVSDLTAWVMAFPDLDEPEDIYLVCRFWCPESKLHDKQNKYQSQYQVWAKQGWLKATPGDAIDYAFVKAQIMKDAATFDLIDLNIDRLFQAAQVGMELQEEGLVVVGMGQGFLSMAAPVAEFERRLLRRKIHHGGNPVLRWMADNVAVKQDPAGNLKPDKSNSQGKIDGIVSAIMALDRVMRHEESKSVYDKRGMRSL